MRNRLSFSQKAENAIRIDRSVRLVWRAAPGWTIVNTLLACFKGVLPLFMLYIIKIIVDELSRGMGMEDPLAVLDGVVFWVLLAGSVYLVNMFVGQLSNYAAEVQGAEVKDYVNSLIHNHSVRVDMSYYEDPSYFDTLHRAQQEGPYRPQKIVNGLVQVAQNGFSLVSMVVLLCLFHWSVGVLLFLAAVPSVLVRYSFAKKQYQWQAKRTGDQRREAYLSWLITTEQCAKEIRLFNIGDYFCRSYSQLRSVLRREKLDLARRQAMAEFAAGTLGVIVLVGCFLAIAHRTLSGAITLGDMVMYFQAFQRGMSSLQAVLRSVASLYEDNLFVSYFFSFLEVEKNVEEPQDPVPVNVAGQLEVKVENVSFRYPGGRTGVLRDVNMSIGKGEIIALVGANGAGKSTLVKLLCRLYDPDAGSITFNGVNSRAIASEECRRLISTVFQDFMKYHLTARENIWLGDTGQHYHTAEVEEAAMEAGIDRRIEKLSHGYETVLGRRFSGGEELSQGEWQKIGIARAFFRKSPLVILDEPAGSLDPHSEYRMYLRLKKLIAGRSALFISHRLSAVRMADRIYVLSGGTISEQGTHDELLEKEGEYADMYKKQARWYQSGHGSDRDEATPL